MNYKTFLVSIDGKDPGVKFLNRFKDIPRQIKPASKGKFEKEYSPGWLLDRDNNDRVVEFSVGKIVWKPNSEAEIDGGYYCGIRCGAHYLFKLNGSTGRWVVATTETKLLL